MGQLMYGYKPEMEEEKTNDQTVPARDSSPEPPQAPVIRSMRRRPGRRTPGSEEIRIRDAPMDTPEETNIQILRVGARLRDVLSPAADPPRTRATPTEPRTRPMASAAPDLVLAWLATPSQADRQVRVPAATPIPAAAPGRVGRTLRNTRRRFISDGRGSGRSYYMTRNGSLASHDEDEDDEVQEGSGRSYYITRNGSQISLDEDEADRLVQGPPRDPPLSIPPSRGPLSTAGLIERLASIDESQRAAVQRMEEQMTPWTLNVEGAIGPTPTEIYREAYRRLDNSTATGDERRVLQMLVQRGIDGMIREERQDSLDSWPRGV